MEQVQPTRMVLMAKRAQIRLARQGADLLNRKKDALLPEFFGLVAEVDRLRRQLAETLQRETVEAIAAEAIHGGEALASAALASPARFEIRLRPRNLWGVRVIDFEHTYPAEPAAPWAASSVEAAVEEVAAGFRQAVRDLLDLAPRELRLRRVGEEIRRTNRKINALEQQLIPRLEAQARAINQVLEERARDDVIRLKRLKKKRAGAAP